ncbi:conserved hypothetical protein [Burkholderiales bacterium 8X]|nr:conserved hypothetical protein [Burkholderiales bacterium 8X]
MTKVEKLCAAYEQFGLSLKGMHADVPEAVIRMCSEVRGFVEAARERTPKPKSSQIAAGLEQGWREMLDLLSAVSKERRRAVADAWFAACEHAYPEFLSADSARRARVLERGKIRTEGEFYRVRYEVDVLEGQPDKKSEPHRLYALIDAFERCQ